MPDNTDLRVRCSMCRERKPTGSFHRDASRPHGVTSRCKQCEAARTKDRSRVRLDSRRTAVLEAKNRPCADCAVKLPPECMDFDHRPGVEKLFALNRWSRFDLGYILREIAKCDVVCANCHRLRTSKRMREAGEQVPIEVGGSD